MNPVHLAFEDAVRMTLERKATLKRAERVHHNQHENRDVSAERDTAWTYVRPTCHDLLLVLLADDEQDPVPPAYMRPKAHLIGDYSTESANYRLKPFFNHQHDATPVVYADTWASRITPLIDGTTHVKTGRQLVSNLRPRVRHYA